MKRLVLAAAICGSLILPARRQTHASALMILPAAVHLGLAYWGFRQKSAFGNVAGTLFALKGVGLAVSIRF